MDKTSGNMTSAPLDRMALFMDDKLQENVNSYNRNFMGLPTFGVMEYRKSLSKTKKNHLIYVI